MSILLRLSRPRLPPLIPSSSSFLSFSCQSLYPTFCLPQPFRTGSTFFGRPTGLSKTPNCFPPPSNPLLNNHHFQNKNLKENDLQQSQQRRWVETLNTLPNGRYSRGEAESAATTSNLSFKDKFQKLMSLVKPEWKLLAVSLVGLALSSGSNLVFPAALGQIIDTALAPSAALQATTSWSITQISTALIGVFCVGSVGAFMRVGAANVCSDKLIARLRKQLYSSIIDKDIHFFETNRTGELVNRLSADIVVVASVLTDNVIWGIRRIVEGAIGIGILFYLSPKLTLVMLSVVPFVAFGAFYTGRWIRKLTKQTMDVLSATTSVAEEKLTNIRTVKMFAQENYEIHAYSNKVDEGFLLARKTGLLRGVWFGSLQFAAYISVLSLLWYGGHLVDIEAISAGQLASFLLYSLYVGTSLGGLASSWTEFMKGLGASERIFELLNPKFANHQITPLSELSLSSTPSPSSFSNFVSPSPLGQQDEKIMNSYKYTGVGRRMEKLTGEIKFDNLSFSYPSRPDSLILDNLSLSIPPSSSLAIVGPSGSGKSTITSLLLRFYEPTKGKILVGGVDIHEMDVGWLRSQIGTVTQDIALFSGTIFENIAYPCLSPSTQNISREEVIEAAKQANAHEFIMSFSEGYETQVGEKGIKLSGGQRQRIAIARALVVQPNILILDEASSALDVQSEYLVQQALERVMIGRSSIVVAHRLSTVKKADQIAVLSNGKIAEKGNHEELLHNRGLYSQLVSTQLH